MASFKWNPKRDKAATLLARGGSLIEVAKEVGISVRTLSRWKATDEFAIEVDRLTFMVGMASKAERLRLANRVVKSRTQFQDFPATKADLLDWLKFIQSETDGATINIAALIAAIDETQATVSRPDRALLNSG